MRDRIGLVDKEHPKISMRKQCELLGVARSSVDYQAVAESGGRAHQAPVGRDLPDRSVLGSRTSGDDPGARSRHQVNRKRLQRLRREIGQEAIWCKPRTSIPDEGHRKYPYLLRDLAIDRPDQVWCADITYVPMPRGHAFLCAVMDWHSRKVLGWALSNTMGTDLCLEALENALAATGRVPEIFNTDQGCQFTSAEWTGPLSDLGVKISMDGRGRWMDNVFIERLWRSVKYERDLSVRACHAASPAGWTAQMVWPLQRLAAPRGAWQPHPGHCLSNRSRAPAGRRWASNPGGRMTTGLFTDSGLLRRVFRDPFSTAGPVNNPS